MCVEWVRDCAVYAGAEEVDEMQVRAGGLEGFVGGWEGEEGHDDGCGGVERGGRGGVVAFVVGDCQGWMICAERFDLRGKFGLGNLKYCISMHRTCPVR